MGSLIASFSAYGCQIHFPNTPATWMVPVYLQIACPLIVCCGIMLCPESPRWLVMKGRREQAKQILIKYHANGDATHPSTEFEMNEIEQSLEAERGSASLLAVSFDIRGLFKTRANRYRLMLAMVMGWCGQFSGSNVAVSCLSILLTIGLLSSSDGDESRFHIKQFFGSLECLVRCCRLGGRSKWSTATRPCRTSKNAWRVNVWHGSPFCCNGRDDSGL